jgi:hypothetical protein
MSSITESFTACRTLYISPRATYLLSKVTWIVSVLQIDERNLKGLQNIMMWYDIYLTAIGLTPGGSSTVHLYTKTLHRTTQNKQYIEQHKTFESVRAMPRLCEVYAGIFLTTEEKAWKTLRQGSRRMPVGKEYTKQSIHYWTDHIM